MTLRFRNILYSLALLPLFIILVWFFAVPDDLLRTKIEDSISETGNSSINASIEGFRKGFFFSFDADSLQLKKGDLPILNITDISGRFNPLFLFRKQLAFSIAGKLGSGDIKGTFMLPESGNLKITNADIRGINYLTQIGIESDSHISSDLVLNNGTADITFEIPDLKIESSGNMILPFINSFQRVQGALSLNEDTIKVSSIGLEGKKGYARLKGAINNGIMNLTLELMPSSKEVTPLELKLIEKYLVSPGYYLIPVKGPFLQKQGLN